MSNRDLSRKEKRSMDNEIERRLGTYGGRIVDLVDEFPDTTSGRHVLDQLVRCGTAPGAHYTEARNAQSNDDIVHKIGLAAKEIAESRHWLRVARHAGLVDRELSEAIAEADELVAILVSSMQTARSPGARK